jgi:hypothetical protein
MAHPGYSGGVSREVTTGWCVPGGPLDAALFLAGGFPFGELSRPQGQKSTCSFEVAADEALKRSRDDKNR